MQVAIAVKKTALADVVNDFSISRICFLCVAGETSDDHKRQEYTVLFHVVLQFIDDGFIGPVRMVQMICIIVADQYLGSFSINIRIQYGPSV